VRLAIAKEYGVPADTLPTSAARLMGFDRTTRTVREAFEAVVAHMREQGELVEDGEFLQLARPD
ncbi:MAG: hypothetical protein AAF743_16275, partial [Planctomycetota bacterium]